MFMVLGSLIYFYAYVDNRLGFINEADSWFETSPKTYIFYSGLGIFALFNLLMSVGLSMYKNAQGHDEKSWLFKNAMQMERVSIGMIYLLIGINFMISTVTIYLALIRINGMSNEADYIYWPLFGLLILIITVVNLVLAIAKK